MRVGQGRQGGCQENMTATAYASEKAMYPDVVMWLKRALHGMRPGADVKTYDTSAVALRRFLEAHGLQELFPQYQSYDIRVDVTGVVRTRQDASLAFVECKVKPITLRDLSQLLGYSRVARPIYSIIISPAGIGGAVSYLLKTCNRLDVLDYGPGRRLKLATWDAGRREISIPSIVPPGEFS